MAVYPLARGKVRTQRRCFRATIRAHSAGLHQPAVRARSVVLLLWYEPLAAALIVPVVAIVATELQCTLGFDFALL